MMLNLTPIREELVRTEEVSCRLCGDTRSRVLFQTDNIRRQARKVFRLVQCVACGFKYFNPSPTEESLSYYYEDYMAHVPEKVSALEKFYYSLFRLPLGKRSPGKLLDIGCGNGKYLDFMRSRGWDVTGVDTGPGCVFPRDVLKIPVHDGHLWNHKFSDNTFDVITLWFVVEHVWDPIRLISECQRILKPDGQVIVSTLNSASFEARLFKRYWWHMLAPEHLSQFDVYSLKFLMSRAGMETFHLRHEPLCCGILGSIQNFLDDKKIPLRLNITLFKMIFIPLDFLCAMFAGSGLITAYSKKMRSSLCDR